jgi:uncharacterized protein YukE
MRRLLTLVAVLVAVVAAGCGGSTDSSSREAYGKSLAKASATLQKTFADIAGQSTTSRSSKQVGDRLERGAKALDEAANRFAEIKPPAEVKDAHRKLVDGLHELAAVFRKSADAARRNDTKSLTAALQGLANSDGVKKITEAQQQLKDAGVTVATTGAQ